MFYKSMALRDFTEVVLQMLTLVEKEDDELKLNLTKILEDSQYKAPEMKAIAWKQVQLCLQHRFDHLKKDELPNWAVEMLKVWTNKV
jgi:hypothetical protein